MSKHQENKVAQILLDSGASVEQIKVLEAESALAGAMEAHGTSISESLEGGDLTVCDLSSPVDVACFIACKNIEGSDKAHGWLISAVSGIAESIESEAMERATCTTQFGHDHILDCMRKLAIAVETLPEAELYA